MFPAHAPRRFEAPRLPGWLAFIIFVPLQIWLFLELRAVWGIWWTLLVITVLGLIGSRAARAPWFRSLLFPGSALRWERRRFVFQIVLAALALAAFLARVGPWWLPDAHPWFAGYVTTTLAKAVLR